MDNHRHHCGRYDYFHAVSITFDLFKPELLVVDIPPTLLLPKYWDNAFGALQKIVKGHKYESRAPSKHYIFKVNVYYLPERDLST